jgi:vitamin B12 transporter
LNTQLLHLLHSKLFCVTCVALFISASAAIADGNLAADDPLQTVVVTATRIPTPEIQVASSVSVITADDIAARQIRTLPDLLREVPGLNVVQTGGPGGQTSVFMRGTNPNHTKVLVDGIDVGDPSNSNGAFDFGHLLTQDIQKVEVLRGPQSGLYGSDAIGGVINVITKSGSGPAQFNASLEAGSFDTFNQVGSISGSADQFHYAATLQHFHSGATAITPLDYLLPGQPRVADDYDNLTTSTKLGFDITQNLDLGLVARYTDSHLRFTGDNFANFPSTPDTSRSEFHTQQYYLRATAHWLSPDSIFEQTFGAAYSNIKSYDFSPDAAPTDNFGARLKMDWQGIVAIAVGQKLLLGAEHQRDEITTPVSASTSINSGYAELQSSFWDRLYDTLAVRYDNNDRFGSKFTYRFAPVYLLNESGTKLKGSLGTGFKAPTLSAMFQSLPEFNFFANPNLKPESSTGWDLGFEQAWGGDTLRFGATYFRNNIKNLINVNADFTSYANVGRAVTEGVEGFVAYQPLRAVTFRLDYTYTQASDETTRLELLRRPKNKESLNVNWQAADRLQFNATVLSVSSWIDVNRDGSIPRLTAPGYSTVDVAAGYDIAGHWTVTARVANLLNRHYQNPDAFDQPTLGAYAGINTKF